ncbi:MULTISPECIES: hypothetical protein [unclassified Methylophaga]|jgi:hypothetical protein|uniref:hypothetical protein n=1 Tax=unclassified Methylophaga TaxID=2629249 RepID=UPI0025DEDFFF|nr:MULTISPECIES: hypothetical protein [unclassified Methylophaga]|tara:strand:- start:6225 stop:6833 length:609 start_codon:yes stop_codon:yes gene_type:complete
MDIMRFGFTTYRWAILLSIVLLSGCATSYVDGSTKEISPSQFNKPEPLHPVQALFEFQSDGTANDAATNFLKAQVIEQIKLSGLFSEVSEEPAQGGALLSITLNNIAVTDEAYSKGFVTGLTFGLAGSQVTDGYICTASYVHDTSSAPIEKRARHAIHTTLGNSSAPSNATKAENVEQAVTLMTRQVVSNVLNDLSYDPAFK